MPGGVTYQTERDLFALREKRVVLFEDKDVPKAVGSGAIDIAVASLTRFARDIPAVDVFYVPFLFDSDAKLRAAVAPGSPVRGPLDEAIAKTGARVLWWQAYGGTVILTKGHNPIKSPADIKGKKVRVFGKLLGAWVTANGGSPVNVAGGEQYFAYQRGTEGGAFRLANSGTSGQRFYSQNGEHH